MSGFRPPTLPEQANRRGAEILSSLPARSPEKSVAQLTIFYGGSVHVYDNVPADKAQAIMLLAGESSLTAAVMAEVAARHRRQSLIQLAGKFRTNLPIVRRNSLRHFLEKRNNRKMTNDLHASSSTESPQQS